MSEFTEDDRYRYGIIDTCSMIHGAITGSGVRMTDNEIGLRAEWLAWRISDGWVTPNRRYDNAVRYLARETISLAMMRA